MTQTIRQAEGRNIVWIMADYGHGRTSAGRKVEIVKVTLSEFVERVKYMDIPHDDSLARLAADILAFGSKGYAYEVYDGCETSEMFATHNKARGWAFSRNC